MNKKPNSRRVTFSAVVIALIGLMAGSLALAGDDLYGSYKVPPGKSTNANHVAATFAVFKSGGLTTQTGLLFMETKGPFKNWPFICEDAAWSASDEAYSCSRLMPHVGKVVNESLTVGLIEGNFCQELGQDKNPHGRDPIILRPGDEDCGVEGVKCACYEITHRCWGGEKYNATCRFSEEETSQVEAACADQGCGFVPPGSGAGSGKNN